MVVKLRKVDLGEAPAALPTGKKAGGPSVTGACRPVNLRGTGVMTLDGIISTDTWNIDLW